MKVTSSYLFFFALVYYTIICTGNFTGLAGKTIVSHAHTKNTCILFVCILYYSNVVCRDTKKFLCMSPAAVSNSNQLFRDSKIIISEVCFTSIECMFRPFHYVEALTTLAPLLCFYTRLISRKMASRLPTWSIFYKNLDRNLEINQKITKSWDLVNSSCLKRNGFQI